MEYPKTDVLTPSAQDPIALKLSVVSGPDFGVELVLAKGSYRIGKEAGNDLILTDTAISRTHLLVGVLPTGIKVTDNDSTNGSFCEGMKFNTLELKPGATLRIGRSVLKLVARTAPVSALKPSENSHFGALAGVSLVMRQTFAVLERLARVDSDVLVQGETGTGKELCAHALHQQSDRSSGPFVICDLAAAAPTLLESELFGHVKGAFTGAHEHREGVFKRAHGGTLFLDEVGDLPVELQPLLLRALEGRQIKPVGSNTYLKVDVRVIAATHKDLEVERAEGRFREDLFHRLAVARVLLPPLRDRPEDISFLLDEILAQLGKEPTQLHPETRAMLCDYSWPGNVRELRNVVERAVALGGEAALPSEGTTAGRGARSSGRSELPFKEAKEQMVVAFERDYLAELLRRCDWNLSKASREAGIARFYLRQLVKKHGLEK